MSAAFPYPEAVVVDGRLYAAADVRRVLGPYLTDARAARLAAVAAARTFGVVPVLDGLTDPGNVHAVLRSAEGLGFGAAHLVGLGGEAAALAEAAPVAGPDTGSVRAGKRASRGAASWLAVEAWPDAEAYLADVRARGFAVATLDVADGAVPIATYDFSRPTVLVLGNERVGPSPAFRAAADAALLLPMDGFVESYNVSVAGALALAQARADRLARTGRAGDLSAAEQETLVAHYTVRAVQNAGPLLRHALGG
ncbi:MAG TPA: TrmH family RNA methyltransferase [Rubricoccaceae bacterium]|jgi:tRNA (guanosine-2'-O-)-methyltransferase